jgi:hypothetical protein
LAASNIVTERDREAVTYEQTMMNAALPKMGVAPGADFSTHFGHYCSVGYFLSRILETSLVD